MRRIVVGLVPALVLLASAATAIAATTPAIGVSTRVYVTPGSGRQHTNFRLSFRIPDATGMSGLLRRTDALSVSGPRHAGCISRAAITLRSAPSGARLRVTLSPSRLGGSWCVGTFHGRIVESEQVVCQRLRACPDLAVAPRTIAQFKFRVKRSPAGNSTGPQTTGPTFAGLVSATACGALTTQILPRGNSYVLTWLAATDPVTPSSGIVYDIYMAPTAAGEDYSSPTWTTSPGVTSYTTPFVTFAGPHYFVVRARDAAGLHDDNTVALPGLDGCACPGNPPTGARREPAVVCPVSAGAPADVMNLGSA
jgi:hypothetical protein